MTYRTNAESGNRVAAALFALIIHSTFFNAVPASADFAEFPPSE